MIARLAAVVAALVPCLAPAAHAGTLADAFARGDDAAVSALRAQGADAAARCTLGTIYARRGELARAGFYLEDCANAELPDDVGPAIRKVARETLRKLDEGDLAIIRVMSTPGGIAAESSALPGEPFTTPATLWVRPGTYEIRAQVNGAVWTYAVVAEARKRIPLVIEVPAAKAPAGPQNHAVSFEDEAIGEQETAPPPDVKHPTLLPKKYRGGAAALRGGAGAGAGAGGGETAGGGGETAGGGGEAGGGEGGGSELVDPLARKAAARPPRAHWLGIRLAGGMFDDARAGARAGLGFAATGRYALSTRPSGGPAAFLAGRIDWSRRGGRPDMSGMEPAATIDVLGAAAGAGFTVVDRGAVSLALIGQLRADLRLASARAGEPVRRAGLGAAAGAELALPGSPITAGLRFEHGLTELVAGARDRAVLLEVGVDWR
ncbi:MAG TPA: hypothetical protein VNO30_44230 [Kofleriaceae bacterium]|nr:hypothetical protein [Kofleriaceae bacterium]